MTMSGATIIYSCKWVIWVTQFSYALKYPVHVISIFSQNSQVDATVFKKHPDSLYDVFVNTHLAVCVPQLSCGDTIIIMYFYMEVLGIPITRRVKNCIDELIYDYKKKYRNHHAKKTTEVFIELHAFCKVILFLS